MTSKVTYLGELRTEAMHIQSGQHFITDAPVDNKGKGSAFSPTDLAATSLAACAITTMAIGADGRDIKIESMEAEVLKVMASSPRRIAEIQIKITMKISPDSPENRKTMEDIASHCPVARSLHPDLIQKTEFEYQ